MAPTSAADLAHGLKGAKFPVGREGLMDQARKNGAAREIMDTIKEMPEKQYASLAEVEHQFSQISHKHAGKTHGAGGTQKGGQQHSR